MDTQHVEGTHVKGTKQHTFLCLARSLDRILVEHSPRCSLEASLN
jgi:hypothetical protein